MTQVNIVVSEHALKPLIHINDLKTVETAVHKLLCMDSLPEPQQKELSNDILYHWVEDTGENGRHCVAPLVHVLVSERLTALFASMMEEPFMCHVMPAESTPRSMDWILVLHFDAFKRIQDMAFTESRKLLTADASIEKFINERVVITKDAVRPNECYAISHDVACAPLNVPKWKTATIVYDHATIRVWQANALEKYAPNSIAKMEQFAETDNQLTGWRGFIAVPDDTDDHLAHICRSVGRDLFQAFTCARDNGFELYITQDGGLDKVTHSGNMVRLDKGIGKFISDLFDQAPAVVDGGGVETVPGNKAVVTHVSRVHPVGSELREEAGALKSAIEHYRTQLDANYTDSSPVPGMWKGSQVTYLYPPYTPGIRGKLGNLLDAAKDLGMVLMFYRDTRQSYQLILCADKDGVEISTSQGIGNAVAKVFGGVCGQPVRK